ncbi:MAG: hypothetical protein IAB80_05390 [Bacteroidetes bacterium]|uniref:Chemotaxis methyl-accepting receptor HlyB-like 4HB MCP domain-containing protein n=1 Tax=Candidatus Cryptobacteroides excrementipullorum TaxID=2840761 RepID=A0A9D9IUK1_9BACT|nr:hypothetical protein [Candidatus Cryptobacteroides excrementipullorum]
MLDKILKKVERHRRMTMKKKLSLGLGSIAAILLLSSVISVLEYGRMSNYVSDLIAADINSINKAQQLSAACETYNLRILATIGEEDTLYVLPSFDSAAFMTEYNALRSSFSTEATIAAADSVISSYAAYMKTSLELEKVIKSDFIDSRQWFFERLQPDFQNFRTATEMLTNIIYKDLKDNSETFQDGFYRSIMPGIVSVCVGLLLVVLLLFFIISYYVNPIYRIDSGVWNYLKFGKRYTCTVDGDDELVSINDGISEIVEENMELKKRLSKLREEREKLIESSENQG